MPVDGWKIYDKMSSVVFFIFETVELCVATLNDKFWTRAKEVCNTLEYTKKLMIS